MSIQFRWAITGAVDGVSEAQGLRVVQDPSTGIYNVLYNEIASPDVGVFPIMELVKLALGSAGVPDDFLIALTQIQVPGAVVSELTVGRTNVPSDGIVRQLSLEPDYVSTPSPPFVLYTGERFSILSDGAGSPGNPAIWTCTVVPLGSSSLLVGVQCCDTPPPPPPPTPAASEATDYSVNAAAVDVLADGSNNLRTGARTNAAGSYTGGGTGNKAIRGFLGHSGTPLGALLSLEYVWTNVVGPGGPFFSPPGGPSVLTPYANLVVDFDPNGVGDIRILVVLDDSLNAAITAAIGTYANPGGLNTLTYAWDSSMDVLIVLSPPNAVPGGVAPNVSVGAAWPENSYSFAALVAANPDAVLVDAYPAESGLPAGAVVPAVMVISGDSGNVTKSGKRLLSATVNGASQL